jgi:hypothetical protein
VVRGGSWNNQRENVRCAYRNRNIPFNRNNNLGFRVVCAHIDPPRPEMQAVSPPSAGCRGQKDGWSGLFLARAPLGKAGATHLPKCVAPWSLAFLRKGVEKGMPKG